MQTEITIKPPENAVEVLPDKGHYRCRFTVRSETSDRLYTVSFNASPNTGHWCCSCKGCVTHGDCKHLRAAGLRGRKHGKNQDVPHWLDGEAEQSRKLFRDWAIRSMVAAH